MLPCQPHATQHRAPLRYKHGFDGVEQRSQRLNRVHGKVRARCRLMTHCGLTLLGVLPAFAKGDALEVVFVDGIKNLEMRFCSHEFRPPLPPNLNVGLNSLDSLSGRLFGFLCTPRDCHRTLAPTLKLGVRGLMPEPVQK